MGTRKDRKPRCRKAMDVWFISTPKSYEKVVQRTKGRNHDARRARESYNVWSWFSSGKNRKNLDERQTMRS
jgi:hypothetical protein